MKKYAVAQMKTGGTNVYLNGGSVLASEQEIVVKYGSREVARVEAAQTNVEKMTSHLFYRRVHLYDGSAGVEILFFPWVAKKYCKDVEL